MTNMVTRYNFSIFDQEQIILSNIHCKHSKIQAHTCGLSQTFFLGVRGEKIRLFSEQY